MSLNLFISSLVLMVCMSSSCAPTPFFAKDSFDADAEIEIPFYIFRSCAPAENPFDIYSSLWIGTKCNESLFDSIKKSIDKSILISGITVSNISDTNIILFDNSTYSLHSSWENLYKSHKQLTDTAYIKLNLKNKKLLNLIPIVTYYDAIGRSAYGYNYSVWFYFSILIFEEQDCIYSMSASGKLTHPFIVEESELDKSQLDIEKLISEVVHEALQPYIKRLK